MLFDIHCHLLPGMDDGADYPDETMQMLRLAASGGTRGIICTPHCNIPGSYQNFFSPDFAKAVRALSIAAKKTVGINIYPGQEVFLSGAFAHLLREGKIITLNRSAYLLCEFDPFDNSADVCRRLELVRAEGYIPIVAHPERYQFVEDSPDVLDRIKSIGGLLQVNKGSLKGAFGPEAADIAHRLMAQRKADFIASDAHSPYMRTPFLGEVHEMICELYSIEYADFLLRDNPLRVIQNQTVYHY